MERYDIRLRKKEAAHYWHIARRKESDTAAIGAAREIMDDGDTIEVWKGMRCIYVDAFLAACSFVVSGKESGHERLRFAISPSIDHAVRRHGDAMDVAASDLS